MTLPALRAGGDPPHIVATLVDALFGMLRVAFVFARVNDPDGSSPLDVLRVAESLQGRARDIGQAIDASLRDVSAARPLHSRIPVGDVHLTVATARLGLQCDIG